METSQCENMLMKTNLMVVGGEIVCPSKTARSLLDIEPSISEDGAFVFYDKSNTSKQICKIAYTQKRGKPELYYDTEVEFQEKGNMTNAMKCVLEWLSKNGFKNALWLLIAPDNIPSLKIAHRYKLTRKEDYIDSMNWYCLEFEGTCE